MSEASASHAETRGIVFGFAIIAIATLAAAAAFTSEVRDVSAAGEPMRFYGSVRIDGKPAPDGTVVTASAGGGRGKNSTATIGGRFGYDPPFYVQDSDGFSLSGSTVRFSVNNTQAIGAAASFSNGASEEVNLSVNSYPPPGGPAQCKESWYCSEWTQCSGGARTRSCVDLGNCGTSEEMPSQNEQCASDQPGNGSGERPGQSGVQPGGYFQPFLVAAASVAFLAAGFLLGRYFRAKNKS